MAQAVSATTGAVSSYYSYKAANRPVLAPDCLVGPAPVTPGMAALPLAEKAELERWFELYERTCGAE